jgi:hypothetical protein
MLYDIAITQFTKMLQNLSQILDHAAAHADAKKCEMEVLLNTRLAPDQFCLLRQVQIACDTAKGGAAKLTGKEAPTYEDNELSLVDAKARIDKTISYLQTFAVTDFDGSGERRISQPRWQGKSLSGSEFALQHMIPNLYFHVTTAYAILRANGVAIGKRDYLGPLPYQQPS